MKIFILLILSALMFGVEAPKAASATKSKAVAAKERLDLSPSLVGIWECLAISKDGGKTSQLASGIFARGRKSSVTLENGQEYTIDRVKEGIDESGDAYNLVTFTNARVIYHISDAGNTAGQFLLVVFRSEKGAFIEQVRFLFTVSR